jgi:thymidylate kinase
MKTIEYEILDKWFRWMVENHDCELDIIFYLRTKPDTCMQRLNKRSRSEEKNRVSIDYLRNLHNLHELWLGDSSNTFDSLSSNGQANYQFTNHHNWYRPVKIIIIDANQSVGDVYQRIEKETKSYLINYQAIESC